MKRTLTITAASLFFAACCGMSHPLWTVSSASDYQLELLPETATHTERIEVSLSDGAIIEAREHGAQLEVRVALKMQAGHHPVIGFTLTSDDDLVDAQAETCAAGEVCEVWLSAPMDLPERCTVDGDCNFAFELTFDREAAGSTAYVDWSVSSDLTVFDADEDHEHAGAPEDAVVTVTVAE